MLKHFDESIESLEKEKQEYEVSYRKRVENLRSGIADIVSSMGCLKILGYDISDREEENLRKIQEMEHEIIEIVEQYESYMKCIEGKLTKLKMERNKLLREKGLLAVQKGICPFDKECNRVDYCTKDYCNYDVCSNGFAYRMS